MSSMRKQEQRRKQQQRQQRARMWARSTVAVAASAVVAGVSAGEAEADETHKNSHNGPRFTLVSTGQIDDPLEDVLEHTLWLGRGLSVS